MAVKVITPNSTTEHIASSDWQANYMQAEPGNQLG
jgi:hypothetical protein